MIEYVNPEGESSVKNTPYELSVSIRGSNAVKIGFLANGFPDSENFLALLAQELGELEPGIEGEFFNKGNASVGASEELLSDITRDCEAVIAAYGH